MKIKGLKIQNIGIIEDVDLPFDHPLMLFFGAIKQGKTTLLNAIRWCFGGAFPSDILRHGQDDGFIELELDDGVIRREFYRSKSGETRAREIMFLRNGRPVASPVGEIKRLVNPFLQDQDHLRKMGETERKQFFAETFAVDTSELDREYFDKDREAVRLRAKIKDYGDIDLTPVPASNAAELRAQIAESKKKHAEELAEVNKKLNEIRRAHLAEVQRIGQKNVEINGANGERDRAQAAVTTLAGTITRLKAELASAEERHSAGIEWLKNNPAQEPVKVPEAPDTSELETKLSMPHFDTAELEKQLEEAARNEERAKRFEENQKKAEQKKADQLALAQHEQRMREIKALKIAKLKEVSDTCGIPGLEFDEVGVFTFEGTQAGMLSTSQLMKLSSMLSALYPQDLGIELIDRAESLGKSIYGFIDRAKGENKTILATIVGEEPAKIPEEVGVFVVEAGKVTEKSTPKPRKPKPAAPAAPVVPAVTDQAQPEQSTPPPAKSTEPTKRTPKQSRFI